MPAPNAVETANVDLALRNLADLVATAKRLQEAAKITDDDLKRWEHISENLAGKKTRGKIRSIPGLRGPGRRKYRHWNGEKWIESSPRAAYCDNDTQVWDDDAKRWENCESGTIIVDAKILEPVKDTPLDPSKKDDWKAKWTLLHVLVHEKAHEVMIEEQVKLLTLGEWVHAGAQGAVAAGIAIAEAMRKASTPEKHVEVYKTQKAALALRLKLLDEEIDEMRRQRERATGDERERLGREISRKVDERAWKAEWLKAEIASLEAAMEKAVAAPELRFAAPLRGGRQGGRVAVAVVDDAGFERLDLRLRRGRVVRARVSESCHYGVVTVLRPPPSAEPDLFVEMTVAAWSGLAIQPDPDAFAGWALEQGSIRVAGERFGVFARPLEPWAGELQLARAEIERLRFEVEELRSRRRE